MTPSKSKTIPAVAARSASSTACLAAGMASTSSSPASSTYAWPSRTSTGNSRPTPPTRKDEPPDSFTSTGPTARRDAPIDLGRILERPRKQPTNVWRSSTRAPSLPQLQDLVGWVRLPRSQHHRGRLRGSIAVRPDKQCTRWFPPDLIGGPTGTAPLAPLGRFVGAMCGEHAHPTRDASSRPTKSPDRATRIRRTALPDGDHVRKSAQRQCPGRRPSGTRRRPVPVPSEGWQTAVVAPD